jgi:hypothetical protein
MEKSRQITGELKDRVGKVSNLSRKYLIIPLVCFVFFSPALAQNKQKSGDARATVQTFFTLLKSQRYSSLYEFLPSKLQEQITREQLIKSLKRLETYITIERMETGRVQQNGDYAVIDTTIYGRLKRPLKEKTEEANEGRITVQQYLFKENNQWKIATADNRTRDYFLKRNPDFNKQFQFNLPRFEIKQNGQWRAPKRRTTQ